MIKVVDSIYPSKTKGFFEVEITEGLITVNGVKMKIVYDKRYTFCLENFTLQRPNFHDLAIEICEHVMKYGK